jgi:acyl-CoA synthetase (AMP-forming)/AMP-acid ligase II
MAACFTGSVNTDQAFLTLIELLIYRAQSQPNQVSYTFLDDGEVEAQRLTYQALDQQARAIAAWLQNIGAAGTRALLIYPPGLEFIAAFFGCLYAGVAAVPVYPPRRNQNLSRLQAITADAQATVALSTAPMISTIKAQFVEEAVWTKLQWLATDNVAQDLAAAWQRPKINCDTLALLQYTSGSTGMPKGVMVSHRNLLHNSALIQQSFADTANSCGVSWLPPYHDMGLIGGVVQPLYVGAPLYLMSPVAFLQKPFRWLQAISHFKATTSGGPNFAYDLCVRKITPEQRERLDLSCWEIAFTGAEPIRAETLDQFTTVFAGCGFNRKALHPCYGMAETTLMVSGSVKAALPTICQLDGAALEQNRIVPAHNQANSRTLVGCGRTWLDQKVLIVNPESCTVCAPDQIGEIWVSGRSVAQGYWNQPEQSQTTFQAYLADTGEGPFLRTGDLGFLREGELFITGRLKDMMIIRGQNHYPQDIELTLEKSQPALRPGCGAAFTVSVKGEERLVIVHEVERNYLRKLNVNEVVDSIRQAVAAEHGLQVYAAVLLKTGSIPKTSSGKIQRHACRTGFLAGSLSVVEDWSEHPQGKARFLHLQAEVESVLAKLTTGP